jgi:hypothetical protein
MKNKIKGMLLVGASIFGTLCYAAYDPNYQPGSFLAGFQYQKNSTEIYSCVIPKRMFGMTTWFTSCNRSGTGWSCTLGASSSGFSGGITTPHNYESYMSTSSGMALCDLIPQAPEPPIIINNPCPPGSSTNSPSTANSSGKHMSDSTSIGGALCAESITVGFDANGFAKSMIVDHYTQSAQTAGSVSSVVNAVRSGMADSTSIGALPSTIGYSEATLTNNANGQTQISGVKSGVQSFR